jgi:hypothetical protein
MDSDGGPHLCHRWKQNKIQLLINSPERLKSRHRTPFLMSVQGRMDGMNIYSL